MAKSTAIELACEAVGGQAKLAQSLKITPQAVNGWITKGRVPAKRALEIEYATNGRVSRHALRPDLYPVDAMA